MFVVLLCPTAVITSQSEKMSFEKTFFIIPSTIYQPGDLIQLGQVIKNPIRPFERLASPLELRGKLAPRKATTNEFVATSKQTHAVSVGLVAHVLDAIKGELSAHRSSEEILTWDGAALETHFFEPAEDDTFITQLQENKAVRQWLRKVRFPGKSAYVITGLKIARNPRAIKCEVFDEVAVKAQVAATVDPQGLVKAGAEASAKRSATASVQGKPEDSYVFAYQLREIKVSPVTGKASIGGMKKGGDLYGLGDSDPDETDGSDAYYLDTSDDEDEAPPRLADNLTVDTGDFGSQLPATTFGRQKVDLENGRDSYLLVNGK